MVPWGIPHNFDKGFIIVIFYQGSHFLLRGRIIVNELVSLTEELVVAINISPVQFVFH